MNSNAFLPDFSSSVSRINEIIQNSSALNAGPLPAALSYADTQFDILQRLITEFESSLDPDHEVGLQLTNFSQSITMQVTDISYEEPVLMVFKGYVNGIMSTLIQHVNQLNFLLTAVPKEPDRPKRKIGFSLPQSDTE